MFMCILVPSMCFAIGETDSYQCSSGMKRIKLAMPPIDLQNEFSEQVRGVAAKQVMFNQIRHKLDELFKSLMDRCTNGYVC